jgi:ubiquinone/menaquinone biosynthesis C-methylase UbiE
MRQEDLTEFKNKQKIKIDFKSINKPLNEIFSGGEYHDYFRIIPFNKLKNILDKKKISLNNSSLHIASCGTGIDLYYLRKILNLDTDITITDFSEDAVNTVLKLFPGINGKVVDNENLPFPDDFFDYTFIAEALHHLPRPHIGLYELLRVSKYGLIVKEPNDSWLTRFATKLGLAQEVEKSGNYVYRYSKREIQKISNSLFYKYYAERFFATHKVAKSKVEFIVLKTLNTLLNLICPSLGNQIIFIIFKNNK